MSEWEKSKIDFRNRPNGLLHYFSGLKASSQYCFSNEDDLGHVGWMVLKSITDINRNNFCILYILNIDSHAFLSLIDFKVSQYRNRTHIFYPIDRFKSNYIINEPTRRLMSIANDDYYLIIFSFCLNYYNILYFI